MRWSSTFIVFAICVRMANAQFGVPNDTLCTACPFPRVADIDQDGYLDLIFTSAADTLITWRHNANGTLDPAVVLAENPHHLTIELVGDVDGDNDPDLVGASLTPTYQDSVLVLLRNDGGTFTEVVIAEHIATNRPPTRLADLDGDGALDIVGLPNSFTGERWFRNAGGGIYEQRSFSYWCEQTPGPFAPLDVEGDGDIDLATYASGALKRVVMYFNLGDGRFGPPTYASEQYPTTLVARPAVDGFDVNGDGFVDLVVGGKICLNEGNGTFALPAQLEPMYYQSIANPDCDATLEAFVSSTTTMASPGLSELTLQGAVTALPPPWTPPFRSVLVDLRPDTTSLLMGPVNDGLGVVVRRERNAYPIPIAYSHPVDTLVAGPTISVLYPPTHVGPDTLVQDGDFYTGIGVFGDSLYTANMPTGFVVITAHYQSFNSETGCESLAQDSIFIINTTGLAEYSVPAITLFPNPADDVLYIGLNGNGPVAWRVLDPLGREMEADIAMDRSSRTTLNCRSFAEGTYILTAIGPDHTRSSASFVVAR